MGEEDTLAFVEEEFKDYRMAEVYARRLAPLLKTAFASETPSTKQLPHGATDWLPVPNIWGTHISDDEYALQTQALMLCFTQRPGWNFTNRLDGRLDAGLFKQCQASKEAMVTLSTSQGHPEVLMIPHQMKAAYYRYSLSDMQSEVAQEGSFFLGSFAVGILITMFPEVLSTREIHVGCFGDILTSPERKSRMVACYHANQREEVVFDEVSAEQVFIKPVLGFVSG